MDLGIEPKHLRAGSLENKEQLAELTIYKEGEVLTGATITSSGVTFKYEVKPLANAVYSVYAADTIKTGYGATVYNRGDLVKSGLTTGADGKVKLGNLHLGKYTVKETKPPHGYILNNAEKSVTFTYDARQTHQRTISPKASK